jgi:hypothetical protein
MAHDEALCTHAHVGAGADKRVGHTVGQLARHTKVADLDVAGRVEEDIARFDVWERWNRRSGL